MKSKQFLICGILGSFLLVGGGFTSANEPINYDEIITELEQLITTDNIDSTETPILPTVATENPSDSKLSQEDNLALQALLSELGF